MQTGDNLKEIRTKLGKSQQGMADHLDISKSSYYRYEKENKDPAKICSNLIEKGISINYIYGHGPMFLEDIPKSEDTRLSEIINLLSNNPDLIDHILHYIKSEISKPQ